MDLDYFKLPWYKKVLYVILNFLKGLYKGFVQFWKALFKLSKSATLKTIKGIKGFFANFFHGNLISKTSYFILGFGHIFRGQVVRGISYFALEVLFILYMIFFGGNYLSMFFENMFTGGNVGRIETSDFWNEQLGIYDKLLGDNSFHIILYGVLTFVVIGFFMIIYFGSIKQSYQLQELKTKGKRPNNLIKDINELFDNKFHFTLLAVPMIGLLIFTIIPLITMILVAFTNYDANHEVPQHLFQWVLFDNFVQLFSAESSLSNTFWRVLGWTLLWAVLATFTSYIFGMLLALLINSKGIKFKRLYRTLFVSIIAVPQFVSLLIMAKMLDTGGGTMGSGGGVITQFLENVFGFHLLFGLDINTTRICIVLVNMWIGIPYSMLMCSGVLMNIPSDLYESAKIDGASPFKRFIYITLPYMLFVTGPFLITQFIGNINNFNVIFLLSGGGPGDPILYQEGAKGTDLLITWLYKLSIGTDRNYKLASVIGILVFVISAVFSLIVYNKSSAVKGEDNFQ